MKKKKQKKSKKPIIRLDVEPSPQEKAQIQSDYSWLKQSALSDFRWK